MRNDKCANLTPPMIPPNVVPEKIKKDQATIVKSEVGVKTIMVHGK